MIVNKWSIFKQFVDNKSLSIQWIEFDNFYDLKAFDGFSLLEMRMDKNPTDATDLNDFVNNYKTQGNSTLAPGVELIDGKWRQLAEAEVSVNVLRGFDPIADTWMFIGTEADSTGAGVIGDTVRIQIAAGDDVTLFPAVDVTTTLTATEAGDEEALANLIASDLNADSNFVLRFSARRINKRTTTLYITAREPGPQGERPNTNDFQVTATGTTIITRAFDNIIRRKKETSLARDPADPTLGIIGISGSVVQSEGAVTGRFIEFFEDSADSNNLIVDGSTIPVDFTIDAPITGVKFINSIRFSANASGIKFQQFLSKSGVILTNGLEITIRSNNIEITFPVLKSTDDLFNMFSRGPDNFNFITGAGDDQVRFTLTFPAPFPLSTVGTFTVDDFIRIKIQDDLSTGINSFKAIAFGFTREF